MQPTDQAGPTIAEIVQKGTSGAIILPLNPSVDAVAAATSLYLGLTKMGKNIALVCESNAKSDLIASDKIQPELTTSGDNLVISFPYTEGAIDKVDYNIQGTTFNLIITPRTGQPKLNPDKVKYTYAGGIIDFIITIDAPNLNTLGRSFSENKNQFQGKSIINIDRHLVNDFYGTVNLINKTSSSTSELAIRFLRELEAEIDRDMATNLYAGLTGATNNFTSYSVNADTFEAAATLLKCGALKKQIIRKPVPLNPQPQPQQMREQSFQSPRKQPMPPRNQNPQHPQPIRQPASTAVGEQMKPIDLIEQEPEISDDDKNSQDWLKPKIFRGTGLL